MSEELEEVIRLMSRASLDDKEAQQKLRISKGFPFEPPETYSPLDMGRSLARELGDFYSFVEATQYCSLTHVNNVSRKMLGYAQFLYESIAPKRFSCPKHLKAKDVAAHSSKLLKDVCATVTMCRGVQQLQRKRDAVLRRAANKEGDVSDNSETDPAWSEEVRRHTFLLPLLLPLWCST